MVTGEGALDAGSFAGKVVGGVVGDARERGVPALVVVGRATDDATVEAVREGAAVVSLVDRFGAARAHRDTAGCLAEVVAGWLGPAPG